MSLNISQGFRRFSRFSHVFSWFLMVYNVYGCQIDVSIWFKSYLCFACVRAHIRRPSMLLRIHAVHACPHRPTHYNSSTDDPPTPLAKISSGVVCACPHPPTQLAKSTSTRKAQQPIRRLNLQNYRMRMPSELLTCSHNPPTSAD